MTNFAELIASIETQLELLKKKFAALPDAFDGASFLDIEANRQIQIYYQGRHSEPKDWRRVVAAFPELTWTRSPSASNAAYWDWDGRSAALFICIIQAEPRSIEHLIEPFKFDEIKTTEQPAPESAAGKCVPQAASGDPAIH